MSGVFYSRAASAVFSLSYNRTMFEITFLPPGSSRLIQFSITDFLVTG